MSAQTPFPDLNDVLDELVTSVRASLGDNLCGVYLQGSFAVGDADVHSDVDFIVVTENHLTEEQQAALQDLHAHIFERETPWAQHLEGSYVPKAQIRGVDPARVPYFYLDNGATKLEWDNHCNTAIVRWCLREYGIPLAGPDPKTLIDPVTPAQLAADIHEAIGEYVSFAHTSQERFEVDGRAGMSRWKRTFLVLSFCRMLHTLATGRVGSKKEAGEWALEALDPQWSSVIQRALDERPDPWEGVHEAAEPETIERTLAFVDYAAAAARSPTARLTDT